jgi:hypothetical protein
MMWKPYNSGTATAREVFPDYLPRVFSNGRRQYVLEPTPFGRVELVGLERGFVVAATEPPPGKLLDPDLLPPRLVRHLQSHGLRPWKVIQSADCSEAIRALVLAEPEEASGVVAIPFLAPIVSASELLGYARRQRAEQLAGLAASQRSCGPLAQLVGPDGVGKRTMTAAVAGQMGWTLAGELPLSRLLIDRILQTAPETALDTALVAAASLQPDQLLVVSDTELLECLEGQTRAAFLRELVRLPRVILLARHTGVPIPGLVSLECPGLESAAEARALVAAEHPDVSFAGAAFELAMRAATVRGVGLIPGRLVYLVELAKALRPKDLPEEMTTPPSPRNDGDEGPAQAETAVLAPDEIASAITLVAGTWTDSRCDEP